MTEQTGVKSDSAFSNVSAVFADILAEQPGTGAQLSIRSGRSTVVSLAGGDDGWGRPWTPQTSVNLWSVSKAVGVAVLVSLGHHFSLADGVSRWWPELVAAEALTVADLLSHRAGLVGLRRPVAHSDLLDWPALTREIETTEPWWRPGDGFGYHAWTFGLFVNELIRRVGGVELEDALRERFAAYADLSTLSFVAAPAGGVARQIRLDAPPSESALWLSEANDPIVLASLRNPVFSEVEANAAWWKQLVLPSAKAYASADGLTAMMSALLDPAGPVPTEEANLMMTGRGRGLDRVLGDDREFAAGLVVGHPDSACPYSTTDHRRWGYDGQGGSFFFVDPESNLTLAWVTNGLGRSINRDPRKLRILEAFDDDVR